MVEGKRRSDMLDRIDSSSNEGRMEGTDRLVTKIRKVSRPKGSSLKAAKPKTAASSEPELLPLILAQLDDDKAEDTATLDVRGRTSIADYLVVTSGRSNRHVAAIAEHLVETLGKAGVKPRLEGLPAADWVLIDAGDVIVHVFRPEVREFYNLEKKWSARTVGRA
jgi:ribosome-associated protein